MSAIFGIIHLNGCPVDSDMVHRMADQLSYQGDDKTSVWIEGPVALGCRMMYTTPESLHEKNPISTQQIHLTATARLDNREDLLRIFDVPLPEWPNIPDNRLILNAYEKWGEVCPEHLLGDFAFVLWDARNQKIFCATDHMALRKLYYIYDTNRFVFATGISGIVAVPDILARLNRKLTALLPYLTVGYHEQSSTLFEHIEQIPKASVLTIHKGRLQTRRYWTPIRNEAIHFKSDAEWLEAFKSLLFDAVGARLRSAFPVASLLSGGLDSSSIVAIAAQILKEQNKSLTTLSSVASNDQSSDIKDEKYFIDQFKTWDNIEIKYITDEWRGPFDHIDEQLRKTGSPMMQSRHYLMEAFGDVAHHQGARVVLDGLGGELGATYHAQGYLASLFLRGRWLKVISEMRKHSRLYETPIKTLIRWQIINQAMPVSIRLMRKRSSSDKFNQLIDQFPLNNSFVDHWLGDRLDIITEEVRYLHEWFADPGENQRHMINNMFYPPFGTLTNQISWAHPLLDIRVLEFCLAMPDHLKMQNGYTRYHIRAALDGLLPPEIQWRTTKEPFSVDYHIRYNRQKPQIMEMIHAIAPQDPVCEIIDIDSLKAMIQYEMTDNRDGSEGNIYAMHLVPFAVYLIHFLRQFDDFKVP